MPCSGSPVTIPRQTRSRPSTACSRSNTTATGSPSCAAQAPRRRLGPATGRHLVPDPGRHAVPRLQPSASPARRRARPRWRGRLPGMPRRDTRQRRPARYAAARRTPWRRRDASARADRTPHDVPHAHVQQDCAGRLRHPTRRLELGKVSRRRTRHQGLNACYGSSLSRSSHRLVGQGWIPAHPLDMCEDLTCRISTGKHSADIPACFPS